MADRDHFKPAEQDSQQDQCSQQEVRLDGDDPSRPSKPFLPTSDDLLINAAVASDAIRTSSPPCPPPPPPSPTAPFARASGASAGQADDGVCTQEWCYCRRISFGNMVECSNSKCSHRRFHLSCTDLTRMPSPREHWLCRSCIAICPPPNGHRGSAESSAADPEESLHEVLLSASDEAVPEMQSLMMTFLGLAPASGASAVSPRSQTQAPARTGSRDADSMLGPLRTPGKLAAIRRGPENANHRRRDAKRARKQHGRHIERALKGLEVIADAVATEEQPQANTQKKPSEEASPWDAELDIDAAADILLRMCDIDDDL